MGSWAHGNDILMAPPPTAFVHFGHFMADTSHVLTMVLLWLLGIIPGLVFACSWIFPKPTPTLPTPEVLLEMALLDNELGLADDERTNVKAILQQYTPTQFARMKSLVSKYELEFTHIRNLVCDEAANRMLQEEYTIAFKKSIRRRGALK